MYAANLTGEIDEMRRRHDLAAAPSTAPASCISMNSIGLPALRVLREHCAGRDSRPSQGLGTTRPITRHRHELRRVPKILAPRRNRSHPRQRPPQQILLRRRLRHRLRPRMPDADVRCPRPRLRNHASLLIRPDIGASARYLSRPRFVGSHPRRRRRHHGPSQRCSRRRPQPARSLGGRSGRRVAVRLR